jgi:hypothetical protein
MDYKPDISIGDSIAFGLQQLKKGIGGDARVGSAPREVLGKIIGLDKAGMLANKKVVLSSGLSNHPSESELETIEQQLKLLKSAGASITLLGISNEREAYAPLNKKLKELAGKYDATFVPLTSTHRDSSRVHPEYNELLGAILAANAKEKAVGGIVKPVSYSQPAKPETTVDTIKLSAADTKKAQAFIKQISASGHEHYELGHTGKNGDGVDGDLGRLTKEAIHKFKATHNLSGVIDRDTLLQALQSEAAKASATTHVERPLATPKLLATLQKDKF